MSKSVLSNKHFAVIGIGNIGRILIGRLQAAGVPAEQIVACDSVPECSAAAALTFGVRTMSLADDLVDGIDMILIAVPPGAVREVLRTLHSHLRPGQIVVSFAAAVSLVDLEALVPEGVLVARVMPNAPSLLGQGMNPVAYSSLITPAGRALVEALLAALGKSVEVRDDQMNWCVGLSGAAMRSLLPVLEGMIEAGIEAGLSPDMARRVASQVLLGTAVLVLRGSSSLEEIKALTPMETIDEAEISRLFLEAARHTKKKIDRLEARLKQPEYP